MSTQTAGEIVTIHTATTSVFGRFLVGANGKHFVSDQRVAAGGPGEAVSAGELLLSSLGSCSLGLIQKTAREHNITLGEAGATVSFARHATDPTRYAALTIDVTLAGVSNDQAATLVEGFTANCPIYNTLKRGGPIEIHWTVR